MRDDMKYKYTFLKRILRKLRIYKYSIFFIFVYTEFYKSEIRKQSHCIFFLFVISHNFFFCYFTTQNLNSLDAFIVFIKTLET